MSVKYILNKASIELKIRRMALEIAERNIDEKKIILAGIEENGKVIAQKISQLLPIFFSGLVELITIHLDKKNPTEVLLGSNPDFAGAVLIIVDDVANSGKTLTYALKPFLCFFPLKIQTLVLVDRMHKVFPVQADYIGFSLSTTLQEYIDVEVIDGELIGAYMK